MFGYGTWSCWLGTWYERVGRRRMVTTYMVVVDANRHELIIEQGNDTFAVKIRCKSRADPASKLSSCQVVKRL